MRSRVILVAVVLVVVIVAVLVVLYQAGLLGNAAVA